MYAIARIAGKQFRIAPEDNVKVPRLQVEVGSTYEIGDLLLTSQDDKTVVGQPLVGEVKATATVLEHGREDKIIVHRKKRRKGFRVTKGHRQLYTLLRIESIGSGTAKAKPRRKKAAAAAEKEGD